jgi:hypothetical protein
MTAASGHARDRHPQGERPIWAMLEWGGAMSSTPSEGHPAEGPPDRQGPRHKKGSSAEKQRASRRQLAGRVLKWGGGLITAALLAFITAYFTVLGNHVASASPQPPAGPPVIATVGNVDADDGGTLVLPDPVRLDASQLVNLSNSAGDNYANWFAERNAAFAGPAGIQLIVQGNRSGLVQIINLTARESCFKPLRGALFYAPAQGADMSAHLHLDLNDPQAPIGYTEANSHVIHPDYFGDYTISLRQGEVFTFQITASVTDEYCQFTLALTGIVNGKTFTESVSNDGRPFRVTSLFLDPPVARNVPNFTSYQDLYLFGAAADYKHEPSGTSLWVRGDPKSYRGVS